MAAVKFVHVLKRMETIERDIAELHALEESLQRDRTYAHSMINAIEKQVNTLLDERVKLMDLKIENPPEHLADVARTFQDELISAPSFSLAELTGRDPDTMQEIHYGAEEGIEEEQQQAASRTIRVEKSAPRFNSAAPVREMRSSQSTKEGKSQRSDEKRSRADILRDLPPLEY